MSILGIWTDEDIKRTDEELKALKGAKAAQDTARIAAYEAQYVEASDAAKIAELHPIVRVMMRNTLIRCKQEGLKIGIHTGYRSIEIQDQLYKQGRKLENGIWVPIDPVHRTGIVTNAKGGLGWHNYGLACDFVMDKSSQPGYQWSWDNKMDMDGDNINDWDEFGEIAESFGLTWGGRWGEPGCQPRTPKDRPHAQYHKGILNVQTALALYHAMNMSAVWEKIV